jgi:hypothetical protein
MFMADELKSKRVYRPIAHNRPPPEQWTRRNHPPQCTRDEGARFLLVSLHFIDKLRRLKRIRSVRYEAGPVRLDVDSLFDYRDDPPPPSKPKRKPGRPSRKALEG